MINIKNFDSSVLKKNKKLYKNIDIYYLEYITTKDFDDYENMYLSKIKSKIKPKIIPIKSVLSRIKIEGFKTFLFFNKKF